LLKNKNANLESFKNLAQFYIEIKNFKNAEKVFRYILSKHSEDNLVRVEFAEILVRKKLFSEAIRQYKKVLKSLTLRKKIDPSFFVIQQMLFY